MIPKDIVEQFVERYNQGDTDALAALYADEAINHQVANQPVAGKDAIGAMLADEFANAEMVPTFTTYGLASERIKRSADPN